MNRPPSNEDLAPHPSLEDRDRPTAPAGPPNEEISFEQAVRQLTEIVQKLERGDLPLEESVALFEKGVRLSAISQRRLDRAQKRVEELLHVDPSGQARTAPFDTSGDG